MKTIAATVIDDVITPQDQIPASAVRIVFDGTNYIVYDDGDELPPEHVYDEQL